MNKYNHYISLGPNCLPAYHLKNINLRKEALPFDWMLLNHLEGINYINNLIDNNFDNFVTDLTYNSKKQVFSKNYPNMIFFHHDLIANKCHTISKQDENNKEKLVNTFVRRAKRFLDLINSEFKILYIYTIPLSSYKNNTENFWDSIINFLKRIGSKELLLVIYNDKDFNLQEFINNKNIDRLHFRKFVKNIKVSKLWGDTKEWTNMFKEFI